MSLFAPRSLDVPSRSPSRSVSVLAFLSGLLGGASAGLVAGPLGAVAGAIVGAGAGFLAGGAAESHGRSDDARDRHLDAAIGVTEGPMGTTLEQRRPARRPPGRDRWDLEALDAGGPPTLRDGGARSEEGADGPKTERRPRLHASKA